MKKAGVLLFLGMIAISLGLFTLQGLGKQQISEKKSDIELISEKIDEVLKNQQDIIARLKDIREQQDIIRVRASRR